MEEKDNELTLAFNRSFDLENIVDLGQDIGDVTIDLISESTIVDTVPVLGLLNGAYKVYKSISAGRLMKKLYYFLFKTQEISRSKREKFIQEYATEGNDNGAEMLLDLINRLDNINKITILCNLIGYRVREEISITDFMRLVSALERLPITDVHLLDRFQSDTSINGVNDSLLSAGLIYESTINVGKSPRFRLNYTGYQMLKYGLNDTTIEIPEEYIKSIPGFITAEVVDERLTIGEL